LFVACGIDVSSLFIAVMKYLREINLKKERCILAHSFRDFSPWLLGPIILDLWEGKTYGKGHGKAKLLTTWWTGAKKEESKGLGLKCPLQDGMSLVTSLLQPGPSSNSLFSYELLIVSPLMIQ
jgi:hypothetical protein